MKKSILFFALIFSLVLTSCVTTARARKSDFNAKEADYALHLALNKALEQSFAKLDAKLEKTDFLPANFKNMESQKDNITGLSTLLAEFNEYTALYLKKINIQVKEFALNSAKTIKFGDVIQTVKSSDTSASELFLSIHKQNIESKYLSLLKDYDYGALDSCIAQYNAYATTKDIYLKTFSSADISKDIANIVISQFEELLQQSEELFRTTPDPYADKTAADVFGIN